MTINATNLPKDRIKMEPCNSIENVTMMVTEDVATPHERSFVNLDEASGIRDQVISDRRMMKIQKATGRKAEALNLPLQKKMAALSFLHGKIPSIYNP